MLTFFQESARSIGVRGLSLRMSGGRADRIIWASVLPFILISLMLSLLALSFVFGNRPLFEGVDFHDNDPVVWSRLYWIASGTRESLLFISLAVLVLHGISRWSRAEASWMFVIGATLLLGAGIFAALTISLFVIFNSFDAFDLRAGLWREWAATLGLLSAGYFFVAYRGLSRPGRGSRPRTRPGSPQEAPEA
jgi:hypothetical protein